MQNLTHSNLVGRIPQCHDLHAGEKSKRFKEPLASTIEKVAYKIEGLLKHIGLIVSHDICPISDKWISNLVSRV